MSDLDERLTRIGEALDRASADHQRSRSDQPPSRGHRSRGWLSAAALVVVALGVGLGGRLGFGSGDGDTGLVITGSNEQGPATGPPDDPVEADPVEPTEEWLYVMTTEEQMGDGSWEPPEAGRSDDVTDEDRNWADRVEQVLDEDRDYQVTHLNAQFIGERRIVTVALADEITTVWLHRWVLTEPLGLTAGVAPLAGDRAELTIVDGYQLAHSPSIGRGPEDDRSGDVIDGTDFMIASPAGLVINGTSRLSANPTEFDYIRPDPALSEFTPEQIVAIMRTTEP